MIAGRNHRLVFEMREIDGTWVLVAVCDGEDGDHCGREWIVGGIEVESL